MRITPQQLAQATEIIQKAYNEVSALLGLEIVRPDIRRYRGDEGIRFMAQDMKPKDHGNFMLTPVSETAASNIPAVELPAALARGMAMYGIRICKNAKGDQLVDFHPTRPKYPFTYQSAGGTRWKITPEQARARFGN